MTVKTKDARDEKKTAARPFRKGTPLQVYVDDDLMGAIDEWTKRGEGKALSRSEAVRRLTARALKDEAKEAAALEADAAKKKGGKR